MLGWVLVRLRFVVLLFWAVVALAAYLYLRRSGTTRLAVSRMWGQRRLRTTPMDANWANAR